MNIDEALKIAKERYGEEVYVNRKPKNGFTSSNTIPSFLGEITSPLGHNDAWWVYRASKNSNRQIGDRPKVQKTFRLDADLMEALTSKAESEGITQTEILEKAIAQYLQ